MDKSIISPNASNGNRDPAMAEAQASAMAEHHTMLIDELGLSDEAAESATRRRFQQMKQPQSFPAMVPEMTVSETSNPRRFVLHPSTGWRFVVEQGDCGPLVLAAAPHHRLDAACYLVEGQAAQQVIELLATVPCADCEAALQPDHAPHIPGVGHVCFDCLGNYVSRPIPTAELCERCETEPATNEIRGIRTCWNCLVRPPHRENWSEDRGELT